MGKDALVDFKTKKELEAVFMDAVEERLSLHPDIINYKNKLRDIDEVVDLRRAVQSVCDNLFGFGKACLVMLFNEDKIPIRLVPLSSYKIGRVFYDKKTFEFLGIEYLEIEGKQNILLASDIIYFPLNDHNVTPNSRYQGRSLLFPILSVAETNLVNRERNFPEIIRKRWASTLLVKTATRNTQRNQAVANQLNDNAGNSAVIPDLVSAENIKIDTELKTLIEFANESDQKIFRDTELPSQAGGFLQISTTAEAAAELHVWAEATLEDMREFILDTLVKQWYNRNLRKIIERDVIENGVETSFTPPPIFDADQAKRDLQENAPGETPIEDDEEGEVPEDDPSIPQENKKAVKRPDDPDKSPQEIKSKTEVNKDSLTPDKNLTILEELGFDINAFFAKKPEEPDKETLEGMLIQKLANICRDIYQDIIEPTVEDIISLTKEIKFPFKIYLKFSNIIFDTFLDRSAGVLGIFSSGIIDEDIALELSKLEKYIPKMRKIRAEKEKTRIMELQAQLEDQALDMELMANGEEPINPEARLNFGGAGGRKRFGGQRASSVQAASKAESEGEEQEEEGAGGGRRRSKNISNPTNAGIAAKNMISNRLAARTNRGRVRKGGSRR